MLDSCLLNPLLKVRAALSENDMDDAVQRHFQDLVLAAGIVYGDWLEGLPADERNEIMAMAEYERRKARERMSVAGAIGGASKGSANVHHPIQGAGRTAAKVAEESEREQIDRMADLLADSQ